jgi:HAD superfamily hydrolase (TIGR01484 family)
MKKRLICFDLDGTLTQHRSSLEDMNRCVLDELSKKYKLIMVGAGNVKRIYNQMNEYPIDIIGNYGMQEGRMVDGNLVIVREEKTYPDKEYFLEKIAYLRKKYGYEEYRGETVEFHSTGMVTFPLLGTEALVEDKIVFDPTREKRRILYPEVLSLFPDYTVYIGGSSSFDFAKKRFNKYDAVMNYAKENGYQKDEILYVGDDFGDGGGDSHVRMFGMDYVEITDYRTLRDKISYLL